MENYLMLNGIKTDLPTEMADKLKKCIKIRYTIRDGSYMVRIAKDGTLSHMNEDRSPIGHCKDRFIIVARGRKLPVEGNYHGAHPYNNTIVMNERTGDIWFCDFDINLSPTSIIML